MISSQPKKVAVTTFGCRANQYDTSILVRKLEESTYKVVPFEENADCYIINSCAITHEAERMARLQVNKARELNNKALVIMTGCSAQVSPEELSKTEGLHYIVGNHAKQKIVELLSKEIPTNTVVIESEGDRHTPVFFEGGENLPRHTRTFLKIQDGCSQFCSFCIVPFARGLNRSIHPDEVIKALYEIKEKNIPEVVLTGIHLGTYGKDLQSKTSLLDLLYRIEKEKPVSRVRLSSIDPEEVDESLIEFLSSSKIFCPHMHLPLQAGNDEILKRMKRRYNARHFNEVTQKLYDKIPDLCLGTDVIVGFPGEDESAFQDTIALLKDTPVSYIHTFPYSTRQGTKAALFEDQLSTYEKRRRARLVRALSGRKRYAFHQNFVGRTFESVVEKRKTGFFGMTPNYISVKIENTLREPSKLVPIKIRDVVGEEVVGSILN